MPRAIWKGAIAFGLVTIPVNLFAGTTENQLDFDLLDKRDFAPVGYKRINKRTGEEVKAADIVKGYEYAKGRYVVVTDEDFRQANVKATQTVDIQAFVVGSEVPPYYFDRPYYLEPGRRGEKGYVLLRDVLRRTGKFGLGTVVLHTRQHLALLIPVDALLILNTIRYPSEIRPFSGLKLPTGGLKELGVSQKEIEMAERLVEDMTEPWQPDRYRDTYREDLLTRIEARAKAGKTREVTEPEETAEPRKSAKVIDLMELLKRSLDERASGHRAKRPAAAQKPRARGTKAKSAAKRSRA